MGFLDRFLGKLKGGAATAAVDVGPKGPLELAPGDTIAWYKEAFTVAGARHLEGDGSVWWQYCLRDLDGKPVVLVAEDCPDPVYSLQRHVAGEVRWDADVLPDVADEPFHVVQRGKAKVRLHGDASLPPATRSVEYREYEDASGERVLLLEDWGGTREVRVGEPVYVTELEFHRARPATAKTVSGARTRALSGVSAFEDAADVDEVVKGTPRAAAIALERTVGETRAEVDRDPTAYDDDEWADAADDEMAQAPAAPARLLAETDDEDEWISATQLVRGKSDPQSDAD